MTNEQREAIELVEYIADNTWTTKYIMSSDSKKADAVLSLIKEQEKQIERLKTDNGNVWQLNANMSKRHLKDICKLKQKDKQIDLMAELVYKRFKAELLLEYGFENEEQLKQYFADLVEKE